MTEAEIIVEMRKAINVLKEKLSEAEGNWILLDFISAAQDKTHWMHIVTAAERLSDPYMPKAEA